MKFIPAKITNAFEIEIEPRADDRGMFARIFCIEEFKNQGIDFQPVQVNNSTNNKKGTIRGLHFQTGEHAEAKVMRAVKGSVFVVAVDLRKDSDTYAQWMGVTLSADKRNMVFYPKGCAVGYQALEDGAEVIYGASAAYAPGVEGGIRYNDQAFNIDWPITENQIITEKDLSWPDFIK
jgi:dTDP-4-dehydrorhamnose 3,5-epimerase